MSVNVSVSVSVIRVSVSVSASAQVKFKFKFKCKFKFRCKFMFGASGCKYSVSVVIWVCRSCADMTLECVRSRVKSYSTV